MSGNTKPIETDPGCFVQTIGDPWMLCKSKTRSGLVYYFNTETGNAVWNLSDVKIENSKPPTNKPVTKLRATTPEPPDKSVMHHSSQSTQSCSRQNSNQITNQFTHQQLANLALAQLVGNNAPFGSIGNNFRGINPLSAIANNFINPLNLNNVPPIYNPNVWAVPNTQQIFITPTVSPLINQTQTSMNVAYNNMHQKLGGQNISPIFSNNAGVTNQFDNSPKRQSILNYRNSNFGQRRDFDSNRYKSNNNRRIDLRQKLSLNRQITKHSPAKAHNYMNNKLQRIGGSSNFGLGLANNDNSKQFRYEDTSTKLDLNPLRELISLDSDTDWYVVVDADVLLNEFKYLNILIDSDPQFHLMVPRHVLSQMEGYVSSSQDLQARRILRFVTEQIRYGNVKLGEVNILNDEDKGNMLSTCLKLSDDNHLVVLTNDNEMLSQKDSIPLHIFTPEQLKQLLKCTANTVNFAINKPSTFIPKRVIRRGPQSLASDNVPTIVTTIKNTNFPNISVTPDAIENESVIPNVTPSSPKKIMNAGTDNNSCTDPKMTVPPIKKTIDAAIQTDICELNMYTESSAELGSDNKAEKRKETFDLESNVENTVSKKEGTSAANNETKTRKIKLYRSRPNALPTEVRSIKERKKWGRRRNYAIRCEATVPQSIVTNKADKSESQLEDELLNDDSFEEKSYDSKYVLAEPNASSIASSSDVYIVNQNTTENIIIEETSMSDVISNSISCVDPKSIATEQQLEEPPTNLETQLMHKVDSPTMEEYLIINCDEWVSRFIQTMEEALTVVLQHDPPFSHDCMQPPWLVHEATQCIKMKFHDNILIVDAANKFSNILFIVGDKKGKIHNNIKPSEYMEMYSYGVNLLEAIKSVVNDCEDLEIASESLKKLLNDIQNPNLDTSAIETFGDITHDNSTNVQIADQGENNCSCDVTVDKQTSPKIDQSRKHNLRSAKKRRMLDKAETLKDVTFIRTLDPQSLFFSHLNLKSNKEHNDTLISKMSPDNKEIPDEKSKSVEPTRSLPKDCTNVNEDTLINEPKIIRNFSKCAVFEEKIKNKAVLKNNYDVLDYDDDYFSDGDDQEEEYEMSDNLEDEIECTETLETPLNEGNAAKFKYAIGILLQDIREAFSTVRNLCDKYVNESKKPQGSILNKIELKAKLKNAQLHVTRLYQSLDSMLARETTDHNNNIQALFRRSGCGDIHFDDKMRAEYTNVIANFKNRAKIFIHVIENLIAAKM